MEKQPFRPRAMRRIGQLAALALPGLLLLGLMEAPDWPAVCPLEPCNGGECQYQTAKAVASGDGLVMHTLVDGYVTEVAWSPAGVDAPIENTPTGDADLGGASTGGQNHLPDADGAAQPEAPPPADTAGEAANTQAPGEAEKSTAGAALLDQADGLLARASAFLDSGTLLGMPAKIALVLIGAGVVVLVATFTILARLRRRYRKKR